MTMINNNENMIVNKLTFSEIKLEKDNKKQKRNLVKNKLCYSYNI